MNHKTGEDYGEQAARLLGYPDARSIDNPGDIDRVAVIGVALINEFSDGYAAGWRAAKIALDDVLGVRRGLE